MYQAHQLADLGVYEELAAGLLNREPSKTTARGFYYERIATLPIRDSLLDPVYFSIEHQFNGVPYSTPGLTNRQNQARFVVWKSKDWQGPSKRDKEIRPFPYFSVFDDDNVFQLRGNSWQQNYFWSSSDSAVIDTLEIGVRRLKEV